MLNIMGSGYVGRDPEMRYIPSGTAVTNFSVGFDIGYGEHKTTQWVRFSAWGKLAEVVQKYLKKGMFVSIIAEPQPDKETGNPRVYEGKNGYAATLEARIISIKWPKGDASAEDEQPDDVGPF